MCPLVDISHSCAKAQAAVKRLPVLCIYDERMKLGELVHYINSYLISSCRRKLLHYLRLLFQNT